MFLRSKVQEVILRRRSRSMNGGGYAQQGGHVSGVQHDADMDSSTTTPRDGGHGGKGVAAADPATFASPKLLQHSSSLPAAGSRMPGLDTTTALCAMSPTSVLDASAVFAPSPSKRRPWYDGRAGLADALHDNATAVSTMSVKAEAARLVRSCSLDRRVEFGVKNKSSWLPLRATAGATNVDEAAASTAEAMLVEMEDYTCVISRGPNPRTVHIFGDRVVEGESSPPRPIDPPPVGATGFLSL